MRRRMAELEAQRLGQCAVVVSSETLKFPQGLPTAQGPQTGSSSRYQAKIRSPRRIRDTAIELRKLIRSRAVAGKAVLGRAKERINRSQPMLTALARGLVTHFE